MRLVYGVGVNDANYVARKLETVGYVDGKQKQILIWACPFQQKWKDMLQRCYSEKYHRRWPTYTGCSVAGEWLTFSNFREWVSAQNWEGNHLDKDLLIPGNKVYGPDTCVFVSGIVNTFITDCKASRGEWPIGVYWHKQAKKFQARCCNPFTKEQEYLGYFNCPNEAHLVWKARKYALACLLADQQVDSRVAESLRQRYL